MKWNNRDTNKKFLSTPNYNPLSTKDWLKEPLAVPWKSLKTPGQRAMNMFRSIKNDDMVIYPGYANRQVIYEVGKRDAVAIKWSAKYDPKVSQETIKRTVDMIKKLAKESDGTNNNEGGVRTSQ